jgi:hypothetical protein
MKKYLLLTAVSLIIAYSSIAQSIHFFKSTHDFGSFNESEGIKEYKFTYTNKGKAPLIVQNVKASCGCTTPEWTKAPILPGKSGYVKVSFDPKNRPGNFNKSITITANGNPSTTILHIKGTVTERAKTLDDKYSSKMGNLMLKTKHLAMTKIYNTSKKTEQLEMFNPTNKPIKVAFDKVPSHILFSEKNLVIEPQSPKSINVTYDASKKGEWGFVTDRVFLIVDGKRDSKNKLSISAEIVEDFSKLSQQEKLNAPKIDFTSTLFNFGDLTEGESKAYTFEIKNNGKSNLLIRDIKTSCGCTVTDLNSNTIKPGQTTDLNVTFNSKGKSGRQMKTITVISNDPLKSSAILRIKGNINKKNKEN